MAFSLHCCDTEAEKMTIAEEDFAPSSQDQRDFFLIDENLPDIVFTLDLGGKFLSVNRAIATLLGYEQIQMLGESFLELFASDRDRLSFRRYLDNVESELNYRGVASLRCSLGIESDFGINCAFMDGDHVFGVVKRDSLARCFDRVEELINDTETTENGEESAPSRLDHFRIITLLGVGAMGRVYRGVDEQLERTVAIKVLSTSDQEDLERFRREARILASISHPNIAPIYYFGGMNGIPFFCMEYLPGGSLQDLLKKRGSLDPNTAVSYTLQVALALNEALTRNVIHMDIKPSNVMLAENDQVKVVDFGLARTNSEMQNDIVGTPYYIAPEHIQTGAADYRCDIYSLGISFLQMLYGFVPFVGRTVEETFQKAVHQEFPPYEILDPAVPKELYDIVLRMTARNPNDRYPTYASLIQDLQHVQV